MTLLSVIIPVYNEEDNLTSLYYRLKRLAENSKYDFEFIFADDCSTDKSFPVLMELSSNEPRIKIIRFSRNFGSHAGSMAGLIHSKGDACAFISADMQEPPELITRLTEQWEKGFEVIIGTRTGKNETASLFSRLYYLLVRRFALKNMPEKGTDVFLIDRKVVNVIIDMKEKNTSIFGLLLWSGFKQAFVPYERERREKGISKWTFAKKVKLFIDTFVSFSYFPIRLISFIGILMALAGFLYAAVTIVNRLFFSKAIEGWASLMVVLLLVSGTQLLMLGLLGEYIWRNFDESRKRPAFIIDKMVGFDREYLKGGYYE